MHRVHASAVTVHMNTLTVTPTVGLPVLCLI